jgi:glycosyltransferase involved in cell wall biosynthesis
MADAGSVHTERWCRYFENRGFETALYSLEPCTISPPGHFYPGRRTTGKGMIDYFLAGRNYRRVLNEFRPDIVNPHFVVSYGWLASRHKQVPIITTAWGSDLLVLPRKSRVYRRRAAQALNAADFVTVDNKNLLEAAAEYITRDKIVKVLMGVDSQVFERCNKENFAVRDSVRIIAPRGLKKIYDPKTIIAGAGMIKGKIEFHLTMFGEEREVRTLRKEVASAGLDATIRLELFLPHREYISTLKDYDIYLSASLSDSTSVALLEAMAVGLIPVVSDIEGNREWIKSGTNGYLFDAGNPQSLAQALIKAADSADKFANIAEINRRRIKAEAIWQDNMQKVDQLVMRLTGQ